MTWSLSVTGHNSEATPDEIKEAAQAAFDALVEAGATSGSISGCTGENCSESFSFSLSKKPADPTAD